MSNIDVIICSSRATLVVMLAHNYSEIWGLFWLTGSGFCMYYNERWLHTVISVAFVPKYVQQQVFSIMVIYSNMPMIINQCERHVSGTHISYCRYTNTLVCHNIKEKIMYMLNVTNNTTTLKWVGCPFTSDQPTFRHI